MEQFGDVGRLSRGIPNDSLYELTQGLPLESKTMLGQTCRGANPALKLARTQRLVSSQLEKSVFATCDYLIRKKLAEMDILADYRLWAPPSGGGGAAVRSMLIQKINTNDDDDEDEPAFYAFRTRQHNAAAPKGGFKVSCVILSHRYGDDIETSVPDIYVDFNVKVISAARQAPSDGVVIAYDVTTYDHANLDKSEFIMPIQQVKEMLLQKGKGEWRFPNQPALDDALNQCVFDLLQSIWV